MKIYIPLLSLLSATNLVSCGYLTGHHPLPTNLVTSRTVIGGAVGGGPSSGAYSSSHLTQTVSTSPHQIQSALATYHPSNYGNRVNQGPNQFNQNQGQLSQQTVAQFTPNQLYGSSQNGANGYNTNNPTVIAYGSYGSGNQGQGGQNQGQGGHYQGQNQEYGFNRIAHGPQNNYGGF